MVILNKLRVGVILSDTKVPAWVAHMLEHIQSSSYAEVVATVLTGQVLRKDNFPGRLYKTLFQLDQRAFHPEPDPWEEKEVRSLLSTIRLSGTDWNEHRSHLKAMRLDILVDLSFDRAPETLSDVTRLGVWSLRCNDAHAGIKTELGWLELLNGESLIRCMVEAHRNSTVQIVARSILAAHPYSFTHNQKSFLWRASALIPRALKQLQRSGEREFFTHAESVDRAMIISNPDIAQITALASKQIIRTFENKIWRRWFPYRWVLMMGIRSGGEALSWNGLSPRIPPRGVFWADPFIVEQQGRSYVFFEEYRYKEKRGRISFFHIEKDGTVGARQIALKRPYHLSYPFIFEYRGGMYMIPETAGQNVVEVYRCSHFPDQWEYHKTIMQNVRAVDATLVEQFGRWWMFVNIAGKGGATWDELHLFHADDPLSDKWTPHPMNPIVSDVRSARSAGRIFRRDGSLIRPSQDSSNRYGYALNLSRITKLTTSEYEEMLIERLEPPKSGRILAVHTYNFLGELTVMDMIYKNR